jgi:hypothetical protein
MILATHALTGAVIGKNIHDPLIIIAASLAIHYIMDSFRHGEYFDSRIASVRDTAWKIILDLSIGGIFLLAYLLYARPDLGISKNILLGSFFSMLPDLLTVLYWKFHWKIIYPFVKLNEFSHRYGRFPKFAPERQWTLRNALNDIAISVTAIILIFL